MPQPRTPRTGVSIAIFRGDRVLLVRRAKGPFRGLWSLPGGHQRAGETMAQAAARELAEETGLAADRLRFIEIHEPMRRGADGAIASHYVLGVHAGTDTGGEARAGDDAAAVRWAGLDELGGIELTPLAADIIRRAHRSITAK
ncbi:MAG: ADP-ribose pyrophosphatase [Alphaproteobacteria bacterium]|nr:MAG: ADP-ribose pyrophosphatase [Alphaproteobacteria bacterium]